jgi:hypothetical protein
MAESSVDLLTRLDRGGTVAEMEVSLLKPVSKTYYRICGS